VRNSQYKWLLWVFSLISIWICVEMSIVSIVNFFSNIHKPYTPIFYFEYSHTLHARKHLHRRLYSKTPSNTLKYLTMCAGARSLHPHDTLNLQCPQWLHCVDCIWFLYSIFHIHTPNIPRGIYLYWCLYSEIPYVVCWSPISSAWWKIKSTMPTIIMICILYLISTFYTFHIHTPYIPRGIYMDDILIFLTLCAGARSLQPDDRLNPQCPQWSWCVHYIWCLHFFFIFTHPEISM